MQKLFVSLTPIRIFPAAFARVAISAAGERLLRRYGPLLGLLAVLSACSHHSSDSLLLIEITHQEFCAPEVCAQAASRLDKLLNVQLGLRSDCAGIHTFQSRNQWMLAKTPPGAKHWSLTVDQSLAPGRQQMTWLLSGPGKSYHGAGDPPQIIKDICKLAD